MTTLFQVLLCLLLLSSCSASEDDTLVITNSGPIRGKHLTTASGSVIAFLGIPYAEPPVGKLRFQKPLPHQPWSHILNASEFGNSCYQGNIEMSSYNEEVYAESKLLQSEDCLFLNIWVPQSQSSAPTPVLVWIHGGGFLQGSGSYDRSFLAATENIIVASMNYRLGALGFLSLPPDAPGNVGLWDQHLALSWLRENIAAFGGDPNRLTLGGQSAGGASVGFHLLSPASQHLFAQASVQSGTAVCPWAWVSPEKAKTRGRTLGQILGCDDNNDSAVVTCLQMKNPGEMLQNLPVLRQENLLDFPFVPTTDGEFLPDDPQKLIETGSFLVKPILTGFTPQESSLFLAAKSPGFSKYNDSLINQKQLLEGLHLMIPEASEVVILATAFIYSYGREGKLRYRDALVKASGDCLFLCPVAWVARHMARAGCPVFAYSFIHRPSIVMAANWTGVPHCSELPFMLGFPLNTAEDDHTYTEDEVELSQRVMRYWGEFIRTGSPNGKTGGQWPVFTGRNFFYINTKSSLSAGISPTHYCRFWDLLTVEATRALQEDPDSLK